jgi:hypothetical protein
VQEELGLSMTHSFDRGRQSSQLVPEQATDLTLDERAMVLATALTIDIDYFSRHSGSGMSLPFFMWGGGGSSDYDNKNGAVDEEVDSQETEVWHMQGGSPSVISS